MRASAGQVLGVGVGEESRRDLYEEHIQYPTATLSRLLVVESSNVELVAVEVAAVNREPDTAEALASVRHWRGGDKDIVCRGGGGS